ncbi:unnamed protein product [Calicophoron daubneyi]|uniref:Uncharacterized protein n=1 Tax=Calicophoron daubneyi TaxID=300641 RepID=A0AAV2TSK0_CALDB
MRILSRYQIPNPPTPNRVLWGQLSADWLLSAHWSYFHYHQRKLLFSSLPYYCLHCCPFVIVSDTLAITSLSRCVLTSSDAKPKLARGCCTMHPKSTAECI